MTILGAALFVAISLGLQALTGNLFPGAERFVDCTAVPVIWYGIRRSQRSAMLTGCLAGLAHDSWFRAAVFGISGFEKTFLGWFLGALSSRFDLNSAPSLFATGFLFSTAQSLLDLGLLRLLDQVTVAPSPTHWLIRGGISGILAVVGVAAANRLARERDPGGDYAVR